jgi:hypothetical protein
MDHKKRAAFVPTLMATLGWSFSYFGLFSALTRGQCNTELHVPVRRLLWFAANACARFCIGDEELSQCPDCLKDLTD